MRTIKIIAVSCIKSACHVTEGQRSSFTTEPRASDWTDVLVLATFQVSDGSVRVAHKCRVVEGEVTHRTAPTHEHTHVGELVEG